MRDAEMLVWAGDFNYRIEASYEDAIERIRNNDLEYLIDRVSTLPLLPPLPLPLASATYEANRLLGLQHSSKCIKCQFSNLYQNFCKPMLQKSRARNIMSIATWPALQDSQGYKAAGVI